MIDLMEKSAILTLKNKGKSNREVARITGFDRKTVAKYWDEHQRLLTDIDDNEDKRSTQELVVEPPRYNTSNRRAVKYTSEIDAAIDEILASEAEKCRELGITHKQHLTCVQIHGLLLEAGYDIGRSTVTLHVRKKRKRSHEAFIRQEYDLGNRLEYDFGEVRLVIDGKPGIYHLAALAAPASNFRWGYLYESQKKDVFLDSHVRFFEMTGGAWREVVYDNMKNVVSRFIGRNEKELNSDLIKMSLYYGFSINVTNCFAAHEKGYVESTVKWIRNKVFATRYAFLTLDEARHYLADKLALLNATSRIEEEKQYLLPHLPPLEIARISEHIVDKYSFIRLGNGFYSVPDYLVGNTLVVKGYLEEIVIFSGFSEICRHKKLIGEDKYSVDIFHYLDTLARKPGAIKNSVALRSKAKLKEVFDERYLDHPRDFIVALEQLKGRSIDEIADLLANPAPSTNLCERHKDPIAENVRRNTKDQLAAISSAFLKGGEKVAC